jgi:hypothetical protein
LKYMHESFMSITRFIKYCMQEGLQDTGNYKSPCLEA